MMDDILQNFDIFRHLLSFLANDGTSVVRLALSSRELQYKILQCPTTVDQRLWKELVWHRWKRNSHHLKSSTRTRTRSSRHTSISTCSDMPLSSSSISYYRELYIQQRCTDTEALRQLQHMTSDLHQSIVVQTRTTRTTGSDGGGDSDSDGNKGVREDHGNTTSPTIIVVGQAWDHPFWNSLLRNRESAMDIFKKTAQQQYFSRTSSTSSIIGDDASSSLSSSSSSSVLYDRLLAFLAARCYQNFYLSDCLCEWKNLCRRLSMIENNHTSDGGQQQQQQQHPHLWAPPLPHQRTISLQLNTALLLEQFVLLVGEIQKTPLELLEKEHDPPTYNNYGNFDDDDDDDTSDNTNSYISDNYSRATKCLDDIAAVCRARLLLSQRLWQEQGTTNNVTAKLTLINEVLVNQYGFSGNTHDYYNYHNVLLDHVLESKKGMPLTLCVVYSCICHRLGIAVQLTGLPGHVVLGYDTTEEEEEDDEEGTHTSNSGSGRQRQRQRQRRRSFMDVFHGGRILSITDCREIVASYQIEWRDEFLTPLSTNMILQRIFNNLQNCHEKAIAMIGKKKKNQHNSHSKSTIPPPLLFCSDLMFQQRIVSMIHRSPPEIANTLLNRFVQELPIVLSPDLLRAFQLLPPPTSNGGIGIGIGTDPVHHVVTTTHDRVIVELSSYVGLSFNNYA